MLASVGAALGEGLESARYREVGCFGTLAAVSTVTAAIKALASGEDRSIKLTGYSGLMLPVMEDVVLAQRATEGKFGVRDLLMFSSVCGVGIDTVPIPGSTSPEALAGVYMETNYFEFFDY